jgi:hypothetical protein
MFQNSFKMLYESFVCRTEWWGHIDSMIIFILNIIILKYVSVTTHILNIVTNFLLFLSGLKYQYPMDNKQRNSEAQINFFASSSTLQFGVSEAHGIQGNWAVTHSQEIFACTACGKVYRYYRNLQSHIRQECGKEPHLLCPYCPYRTKIKSNLKKHLQLKHSATGTQTVIWTYQSKVGWGGSYRNIDPWNTGRKELCHLPRRNCNHVLNKLCGLLSFDHCVLIHVDLQLQK